MSFSESGGVITQSGTDTDFTGLSGLAGVTLFEQNGRRIYILNNLYMNVGGTLSHDPEAETLFFENYGSSLAFKINGTYNLGSYDSATGRYSTGTALRFGRNSDSNYLESRSDIYVNSGGTFNWYGGTIHSQRQLSNYGTWNTFSQEAKLIGYGNVRKEIRQRSANCNIDGFVTKDYSFAAIANANQIENWTPYNDTAIAGFIVSSAFPNNTFAVTKGLNPSGITAPVSNFWQERWVRFINCFTGSNIQVVGLASSSTNNKGLIEIRQEVRLKYADLSGNSLDGVKVSMTDTNNSNRLPANQIQSNPDYTTDRSYAGTSSSGEILFDTDGGVLVAVQWRTTGGTQYSNNQIDYRSSAGNNTDLFTFYSCDYSYQVGTNTKALKGENGVNLDVVMLPDLSITEATKATVDAYPSIDNAAEFYDRAKAYLYDNYAGESAVLVSRDGTAIDAGSFDVTIDATAASAFAVSGNTITIKSSRYVGNITTTGIITLSNGAVAIGTLTDTTGTTTTTSLTFTGLQTNTEVRVYSAGTATEVAGVENSGTSESFDITDSSVDVVLHALGYLNQRIDGLATTTNVTLPISQVLDRQYNNP